MKHAEICIAGAGLIGASIALELARRGQRVTLLSASEPLAHASTAAAGMLAVDDPENPPTLHALSSFSRGLYPGFLEALQTRADAELVRFQTRHTLQSVSSHHASLAGRPATAAARSPLPQLRPGDQNFVLLEESSLDPRELAHAVRLALHRTPAVHLERDCRVVSATELADRVILQTASGGRITAGAFVDCTGAWSLPSECASVVPVYPRKGQILTVTLPPALRLEVVVRTSSIYIVPRVHGAQRGRAVIGATVEDRGFNTDVEPEAIADLRARAAALLPELADAVVAETWAGLRPATADGLPVIGRSGERSFIAKGHYRNGILLAPATAHVLADLLLGVRPAMDLSAFSPHRHPPS